MGEPYQVNNKWDLKIINQEKKDTGYYKADGMIVVNLDSGLAAGSSGRLGDDSPLYSTWDFTGLLGSVIMQFYSIYLIFVVAVFIHFSLFSFLF